MNATGDDKSGSGWGEKELDTYRFQKESKRFPLKDFPWKDLFADLYTDPIADISSILDETFGSGAESGGSLNAGNASIFYDMLRALTGPPVERYIKNMPQTRSKAVDYSSPSLPSASTQRPDGTISKGLISGHPLTQSPLYHAGLATSGHPWLRKYPHPEIDGFDAALGVAEREQSPVAALLQRRGIEIEDSEATPRRSLAWSALESRSRLETPRIDGLEEEPDASQENVIVQAASRAFQYISCSQAPAHVLGSDTNHPSSESGSTYRASSVPIFTSSPPILTLGSSPPPTGGPKYADQAEEGTNSMIYALLLHLCSLLSRDSTSTAPQTVFSVSHHVEPLRVPTGDGGFIKTIPDLEVNMERNGYSTPILDYEGKRLKPNMTSIEKFAQRVAHLIGRAAWNRAARTTSSRNVYLLTAQHTSVSIMQCTLLHKWLDRLPSDLDTLKKFARIQVQEYGPLDLADGAERLMAVQMICRLLLGLGMAAKLGEAEKQSFTNTHVRKQESLDRMSAGDDAPENENNQKKKKKL